MTATLTGAAVWLMGWPFLTSGYVYAQFWPMDEIGWTTAALFDLGVFFCVLGAVVLRSRPCRAFSQHTEDREKPCRRDPLMAGDRAHRRPADPIGIYLILRLRSFPVILGLTFLSYAVNLFIFAAGA